jgi:thymidine phosphorylase
MFRAVDIIRTKRDGDPLSREAIDAFVDGVTSGTWPDYQASALLMAIVLRGMSAEETAWLTDAMVRAGRRLELSASRSRSRSSRARWQRSGAVW